MTAVKPEPLSEREEEYLRKVLENPGGLLDNCAEEGLIDRLVATIDRERAARAEWQELGKRLRVAACGPHHSMGSRFDELNKLIQDRDATIARADGYAEDYLRAQAQATELAGRALSAESKLAEAVEALENIRDEPEMESNYTLPSERMRATARAALARLRGAE